MGTDSYAAVYITFLPNATALIRETRTDCGGSLSRTRYTLTGKKWTGHGLDDSMPLLCNVLSPSDVCTRDCPDIAMP